MLLLRKGHRRAAAELPRSRGSGDFAIDATLGSGSRNHAFTAHAANAVLAVSAGQRVATAQTILCLLIERAVVEAAASGCLQRGTGFFKAGRAILV